jgi:hypothetical protein
MLIVFTLMVGGIVRLRLGVDDRIGYGEHDRWIG